MKITETKKLNLDQLIAAYIIAQEDKCIVIPPRSVAKLRQDCKISMQLDSEGNFILTIK